MIYKIGSLKIVICMFIIFSFAFLNFSHDSLLAADFAKRRTKISLEKEIESVEKTIEAERYKIRLGEAREYLEKGDRYYTEGKLSEALGEWYTALALLSLLKDVEIDTVRDARLLLERELVYRIEVEEVSPEFKDPRRSGKIDAAVSKILEEQAKEKRLAEVKKEKRLSLKDLEIMRKNREAVEQKIAEGLVSEDKKEEVVETKENKALRRKMEAKERRAQRQKAREERLEIKRASSKQKKKEREETSALRKDKVFKDRMEDSIAQGRALRKKQERKLSREIEKKQKDIYRQYQQDEAKDKEFKRRIEGLTQKEIEQDTKKAKQLKAKLEREEKKRLGASYKSRQGEISRELQDLEREQTKITRLREKKAVAAQKRAERRRREPDRFDIIDRILRRVEGGYRD